MRNERTPIAVEGLPFIAVAAGVTGICFLVRWNIAAIFLLVVTLFICFFFRNPKRRIPTGDNMVLAPADGVVIYLGKVTETHLEREMMKVSIFMSVFNVHVNRAPVTGTVVDKFYIRGKFLDVRDARSTFENEQSGLVIQTPSGARMVVVQVAGLIARRIVSYPVVHDVLQRGKIYGLIRFGSRLDVFLPPDTEIRIGMGDKTVAGETVLGILQ